MILTVSILFAGGFFLSLQSAWAANCCYHECNLGDPNKCDGDKVMECKINCDSDHYYDWCEIQDCSLTGQSCAAGACGSAPTACTDGTAANACSSVTGSPWYCNGSLALTEKCSTCGCAGSWACSTAGTYCCDNTCNGTCSKAGCTYDKDPDCACHNGDGCCGLSCTNATDNDCPSSADTVLPTIGTFTTVVSGTAANISYTVNDAGGSHLDRIEIWRAPDNSGIPGVWAEVPGLRETITASNLDNYTKSLTDNPGTGIWWYGLHVVDQAGNLKTEPSPAKITITSGPCTENWSCTAWSACNAGIKTRICTDTNSCSTTANKPDEKNFCLTVKISNPSNNVKISKSASTASFDMDVFGGQEPYAYYWKSNLAGDFSSGNRFVNPNISSWTLGAHTITASTQDGGGTVASESITVQIVPAGTLTAQISMNDKFSRAAGMFISSSISGGASPYSFLWKSDKSGIFSTNQSGSINVNTWPLGAHHITMTVTDASSTVVTLAKDVEIVDFAVMNFRPVNGLEVEQMFSISFFVNLSGGQAPYNIKWQSDKDGVISDNNTNVPNDWFIKDSLSIGYHNITLTATDSNGLTDIKTSLIKIKPLTPITVSIASPANNSTIQQGDTIVFKETHNGGVNPNIFEWKSSLAGIMSTSTTFTLNNNVLPVGNHVITATVKDSKGNSGQAIINLAIAPPSPLNAVIATPASGSVFKTNDQAVELKGTASGGVMPYTYSWSSNINGSLGNDSRVITNLLSPGSHIISFSVKDSQGTVNTATINITINSACSANNIKNPAKYQPKETFLIPDNDWRAVLSLVPVAVWQEGTNIKKYPALVYHQEAVAFDADATVHFLQLYNPDHLTSIGSIPTNLNNLLTAAPPTGAGIAAGNITNTLPSNYFSYWSSFNTIVITDYNNYKAGLLASVLASHKNAPLIFVNSTNLAGYQAMISGKSVYVVDNLDTVTQNYIDANAGCQVKYAIDELQKWYAVDTQSDKLLLTNPKDLNIMVSASFTPEKSAAISKQFGNMSLTSPFLAAARQEVIVFTELNDSGANSSCAANAVVTANVAQADTDTANAINNLFISKPNYLTVVAAPRAIPDSEYKGSCYNSSQFRLPKDYKYGSLDNSSDTGPKELKAGRIYGVTVSDASSYIAKSLNFDFLNNKIYAGNYSGLAIAKTLDWGYHNPLTAEIRDKTVASGYSTKCYTQNIQSSCTVATVPPVSDYLHKNFIIYSDHGTSNSWWGVLNYNQIPWLDLSLTIGNACSNNNYWTSGSSNFGVNMIRRGAIMFIGAAGVGSGLQLEEPSIKPLMRKLTEDTNADLGDLYNLSIYGYMLYGQLVPSTFFYYMLGDPVLQPKFKPVTW